MDSDDSGVGIVIGIIVVIFFGWLIFSGTNDSSSDNSSDIYESSTVENDYESVEEPQEFNGYECSDDCSGHEAGYNWADENDICSEYGYGDEYYDSSSDSFNEGVTSYIEESC